MAEKTELLEEDEKVVEIELERLRGFEPPTPCLGARDTTVNTYND